MWPIILREWKALMNSNHSTCYNLSIAKEVIPAIISFGKLYCPSYLHQTTVPTTILFFSLKEDHKISRRKNIKSTIIITSSCMILRTHIYAWSQNQKGEVLHRPFAVNGNFPSLNLPKQNKAKWSRAILFIGTSQKEGFYFFLLFEI